jgi:hypothetical protein
MEERQMSRVKSKTIKSRFGEESAFGAFFLLCGLLAIAFWVAAILVGIHFLAKVW